MGKELLSLKIGFLKEFGKSLKDVRAYKLQPKEPIKGNLLKMRGPKLESFFGIMESIIQVSGQRIKNMALAFGNQRQEMYIWDSGQKGRLKVMEFI